ncbi:MAG: hypothetical protein R6W31_14870 [Bacteroidales bacterium]
MHFVKECAETSDLEPENCWLKKTEALTTWHRNYDPNASVN